MDEVLNVQNGTKYHTPYCKQKDSEIAFSRYNNFIVNRVPIYGLGECRDLAITIFVVLQHTDMYTNDIIVVVAERIKL